MIIEISKKYKGSYTIWDKLRIKKAFNYGHGTIEDLKRYMKDNKQYCYFLKMEE